MSNVICIGNKNVVMPYSAVGFDIRIVSNSEEAVKAVNDAIEGKYSLIFVQEDYYEDISDVIEKTMENAVPVISAIPGPLGASGKAFDKLREIIKRAIGADIF